MVTFSTLFTFEEAARTPEKVILSDRLDQTHPQSVASAKVKEKVRVSFSEVRGRAQLDEEELVPKYTEYAWE